MILTYSRYSEMSILFHFLFSNSISSKFILLFDILHYYCVSVPSFVFFREQRTRNYYFPPACRFPEFVMFLLYTRNYLFAFRQLQLPGGPVPPVPLRRLPHGPVLHPDHPDCGHLLGLILDGRRLRAGENYARRDDSTHSLKQIGR